jgi:hypothetical protein
LFSGGYSVFLKHLLLEREDRIVSLIVHFQEDPVTDLTKISIRSSPERRNGAESVAPGCVNRSFTIITGSCEAH